MRQHAIAPGNILARTLLAAWVLWFSACVLLFTPRLQVTSSLPVDAVVVLGGSSDERLPVARQLVADVDAPVLVVSWTNTPGNAASDALCREAALTDTSLACFRPVGMDTRSEADTIGNLVAVNGWTSISVVTSSYHVPRSRTLIEQCTTAQVSMLASRPDLSAAQWIRRFVIESVGLIDVHLRPECSVGKQ